MNSTQPQDPGPASSGSRIHTASSSSLHTIRQSIIKIEQENMQHHYPHEELARQAKDIQRILLILLSALVIAFSLLFSFANYFSLQQIALVSLLVVTIALVVCFVILKGAMDQRENYVHNLHGRKIRKHFLEESKHILDMGSEDKDKEVGPNLSESTPLLFNSR
mmetsp:Transcript_26361/g.40292  ORF Transcript_26361/g.40292 Transcript_26361/m.40292 type:complete len:164 (-) Transcript_26361:600-1091(-)|eukprot:CAMPEP_0194087500 /NCGR_PEP_ID=MMETSP0149-20130528/25277_1 /TAXON_ID=122233 /ORGANISM="Chaetoceros debilis, Strain MM31A-1" /LENGTH=163 /DNA_ID=CAMNT_0038770863 /DNA_START=205 /DNA_END=696 /DNA_ORIENTATION=-